MGGMPSRGGPPEVISDSGTVRRWKSVFQPLVENSTRSSIGRGGGGVAMIRAVSGSVELVVAGAVVADPPVQPTRMTALRIEAVHSTT
jgi:hypothetical protein